MIFDSVDASGNRTETTLSKLTKSELSLGAAFATIRLGKGILEKGFEKASYGMEKAR
jgi:hypothetical protein